MPNYQNGKIYCIRSFKTDDIYIGSTTQPLCKRIDQHRSNYKHWIKRTTKYISSVELIKYGDAYIELISSYPCNSKEELKREEGKYQREMKCVNKCIAGRTIEEWIEDNPTYQKDYYEKHKDKKNEYDRNRPNKDERREKNREYQSRPEVKERRKIYSKEYREKTKERRKEYDKNRPDKEERKQKAKEK